MARYFVSRTLDRSSYHECLFLQEGDSYVGKIEWNRFLNSSQLSGGYQKNAKVCTASKSILWPICKRDISLCCKKLNYRTRGLRASDTMSNTFLNPIA